MAGVRPYKVCEKIGRLAELVVLPFAQGELRREERRQRSSALWSSLRPLVQLFVARSILQAVNLVQSPEGGFEKAALRVITDELLQNPVRRLTTADCRACIGQAERRTEEKRFRKTDEIAVAALSQDLLEMLHGRKCLA